MMLPRTRWPDCPIGTSQGCRVRHQDRCPRRTNRFCRRDGIIVGSALVDIVAEGLENGDSTDAVADRLEAKARDSKTGRSGERQNDRNRNAHNRTCHTVS